MILSAMEKFEKMSNAEKTALFNRIFLFPASTLAMWFRADDIGGRLVSRNVGLMSLAIIVMTAFMMPSPDRTAFFIFGIASAFSGVLIRIRRWYQHRRGVRQHSYYLGTSRIGKGLPAFFRRHRRMEKLGEPLLVMVAGMLLIRWIPMFSIWLLVAGFALVMVEGETEMREHNESLDLVDSMVKSEIQTEQVDRFSEPTPPPAVRPARAGAIPTGLGADIAVKIKRR